MPPEDDIPKRSNNTNQVVGNPSSTKVKGLKTEEPANSPVCIKEEPQERPSRPKRGNTQPEVIDLSDSPPRKKRPSTNSGVTKQSTIKSEPVDLSNSSNKAAERDASLNIRHGQETIKHEPEIAVPTPEAVEDPDLAALEDEIKREEGEFANHTKSGAVAAADQ